MEKEWLEEMLRKHGNANNISRKTGVAKSNIYRGIKKHKLKDMVDSSKNMEPKELEEWQNRDWLEAMLLKHNSGKKIAEVTGYKTTSINRWIRHHGLEKNRDVGKNIRRHQFEEGYFKRIDSSEKAYWLGFLVADGCVMNHKGSYAISVTLGSQDKEHLKKMRQALKGTQKIFDGKSGKGTPHHQIVFHSKEMFFDLKNLGLEERKTGKEVFPLIDELFKKDFIRGYFDGDGSTMTKSKYVEIGFHICSASKSFIERIRDEIKNATGVDLRVLKRESIYIIQTTSRPNCKKIYSWMYQNEETFLDRKMSIISKFLSEYSSGGE